jgi:MFS family permease
VTVASDGTIAAARRAWRHRAPGVIAARYLWAMLLGGAALGAAIGGILIAVFIPGWGWIVGVIAGVLLIGGVIVFSVRNRTQQCERYEAESRSDDRLARFGARESTPISPARTAELRELATRERERALQDVFGMSLFGLGLAGGVVAVVVPAGAWLGVGGLCGASIGLAARELIRLARAQRLFERTETSSLPAA